MSPDWSDAMSDPSVREAIERVSAAFAADPAKARAKSAATARLAEGLRFEVTGPREQRVATDMPPPMGGKGSAPNPGWLLRAAVASCLGTVIAMRAAKLGVALSTLEVTVESESDNRALLGLDESVAAGLGGWRTQVTIGGDAEAQTLRDIAAWAEAHSPVGCTLRKAAPCTLEIALA
jgi:uncharacterized OsmC-like protein